MDAWVYMDHGHVFANAQTGNVVLFGIHVAAGNFTAAARHVPSIMAFILWACLVPPDRGLAEEGRIELPERAADCRMRPTCSTCLDRKSLAERSGNRICWFYRGGPDHKPLSHRRCDVQHRDDNGKSSRRLLSRERDVI
jgi:Protein of unknown function (DUF1275)